MWFELVLTAFFTVSYVDLDYDGTYNILLEDKHTGNMVSHHVKDPKYFKEGDVLELRIRGECSKVYEVLEGNGKRGSPWCPEDDWYHNRSPYICNALEVGFL